MSTITYADREIAANALQLHYQEWGDPSAPPILMLHGFGVSGHMFDEFAERMQHRFRLIALDQRGHGDSEWANDGDYTRAAFVADVEEFRKALGLDQFILVGHSMGGLNAVAYTIEHPHQVRALILVDVGPEAAKEGVDNILRFTRGPDELDFDEFVEMAHRFNARRSIENIRERMRHRLKQLDNGKWTWKFDSRFRKQDSGLRIGSELSNDEVWAQYRAITAPSLLVRGAESDVLTQEVAERCIREMQRARLVVVPEAGHSVPGDSPDAFTEVVREFIDDVDHGEFEPLVSADPPPLAALVTAQTRATRRRARATTLALVGAGAIIAIVGVALFTKRPKTAKAAPAPASTRDGRHIPAIDPHAAAAVLESLSALAARNAARAQALVEGLGIDPREVVHQAQQRLPHAIPRQRNRLGTVARIGWKTAAFVPKLAVRRGKPRTKDAAQRLEWKR